MNPIFEYKTYKAKSNLPRAILSFLVFGL
jgi:hypothetical protein